LYRWRDDSWRAIVLFLEGFLLIGVDEFPATGDASPCSGGSSVATRVCRKPAHRSAAVTAAAIVVEGVGLDHITAAVDAENARKIVQRL
jgi:hypothetical protein